jgi:HAD superfamily hydrolase (TIGR01509 family)
MADSTTGGVLWDLDGTLVDSADLHWRSWRETLAREDIAITYEQFLDSFGQKNDGILRRWLGSDAPPDRLARIDREKEGAYRRLVEVVGLTPLPGAAEWIRRLHAAGWRQAIASSAPRENVTVMLRALGVDRELDAIAAAEDVTAGKPDPQVFLAAAERLGLPPDRCIVVEDAAAGVEAARRAGMRSIGVSRERPLPADLVVASLAELPADAFDNLLQRTPHTHA